MCSCNKGRAMNAQQMISTVGSTLPYLKFAYCAYKTQFEDVFRKVGITVSEDKLPLLANLYETGGDKSGQVKGPNGPINFSVQDQMALIDTSKPENNSCAV